MSAEGCRPTPRTMLDSEGKAVATTRNFNVAVALATFGFPYRLERLRDEPTGEVVSCLWHFDPEPIGYAKAHPDEPMPGIRAQTVLRGLRDGTLEAGDPAHPVLDVLHGLNIHERIRTFMERATRFHIAATPAPGRYTLIEGHEPAADNARASVATDSLELATALVRLGHPLLACDGSPPHRRLILAQESYDESTRRSATEVAALINSGDLQQREPAHPALWCIVGLRNRKAMRSQLQRDAMPMLLRNPRSLSWERHHRSVITLGEANGKIIDRARQALR